MPNGEPERRPEELEATGQEGNRYVARRSGDDSIEWSARAPASDTPNTGSIPIQPGSWASVTLSALQGLAELGYTAPDGSSATEEIRP